VLTYLLCKLIKYPCFEHA